jgi:hypothetical protein
MATPHAPVDSAPNSLSMIRRRLISAAPDGSADPRSETVDFDAIGINSQLQQELEESAQPEPGSYDDVESLLQRYQAEKGGAAMPELELRAPSNSVSANGLRRAASQPSAAPGPARAANGSFHGEVLRPAGSRHGLPPLTGNNNFAELDKVRSENAELRAMVADLRHFFEENDPAVWEHKLHESDELIASQKKQIDEWQEKLQTHRLVPSDHDLAEMSDELEKERCQLAQDRKTLEAERQQLREDEESLMKQMRDMEVSMAKDRADLARQRTEIQRIQGEIRHELDILQRGDASVKDRLASFQRRSQEAGTRPYQSPTAPLPTPGAAPMAAPPPKVRDSGVFKRLFGQGNG